MPEIRVLADREKHYPMAPPTREDYTKSAEIEDQVMSQLKPIYHALQAVSTTVADHRDVLRRCGSPLANLATGCPPVDEAWAIVEEIARSLHAFRVVPRPADDESDEAFIRYMEQIEEAKQQWTP
jgi:hypothetical protein